MKQTITEHPNKQLYTEARDIPVKDIKADTFSQIGASMLEILKTEGGIGLSANQVGLPFNMCVVEVDTGDPKILLNPRITKMSKTMVDSREGCLSIPGVGVTVKRHDTVTIEYEDVTGETKTITADGLLSCCLQHEIDHLKGILMINRLNEVHKNRALKQYDKYKKYRKQARNSRK